MTERPGQYGVTGRRSTLTGPTPSPPTATGDRFKSIADETKAMEDMIREALVAQEMRIVARMYERDGNAESAALTMARRSAKRRGGLAVALGTALGIATTFFASAWAVIERYRAQTTEEAAQAATEAVAPSVAPAVAPLVGRIEANEQRLNTVDHRLERVELGVTRVLELLEPATQVHVPQQRKRPR